jgi:hypothetical protein
MYTALSYVKNIFSKSEASQFPRRSLPSSNNNSSSNLSILSNRSTEDVIEFKRQIRENPAKYIENNFKKDGGSLDALGQKMHDVLNNPAKFEQHESIFGQWGEKYKRIKALNAFGGNPRIQRIVKSTLDKIAHESPNK